MIKKYPEQEIELLSQGPSEIGHHQNGKVETPKTVIVLPAVYEAPKQVFYGQALTVAALCGTSNFLNGFLEHQDFTVTCLNFTGFFLLGLAYKVFCMMKGQQHKDGVVKRVLFYEFYDFDHGRVNWEYTIMLLIRVSLLLVALWAAIMSIYYANLANINFGIISCCFIFSIVVNITAGYAIFQEKISAKQVVGIVVILTGIIWISLAKGEAGVKNDIRVSDDEANWYKSLSVMLAISVGAMNASTTVQAKWMRKKRPSIDVMNLMADTFLLFAVIFSLITLFMIFKGDSSLTMRNFLIVLASSLLQTLCGYIGQNCSVKGIAGPTIALIYTQCFFTTGLQVLFLGMIPTLTQLLATGLAFTGILIIIFWK